MNIPYLSKCLETNKLSDLVAVIDLVPLDLNLAIEDAIAAGEISVDKTNDIVTILVPEESISPWGEPELTSKLLRTIQHYATNNTNITRGRMNSLVKDPVSGRGYPTHEYVMSMQSLIDSGQVVEEIIDVPKAKQRPAHKFVFMGLSENDEVNSEWNAKAVNKWLADFQKTK